MRLGPVRRRPHTGAGYLEQEACSNHHPEPETSSPYHQCQPGLFSSIKPSTTQHPGHRAASPEADVWTRCALSLSCLP